MSSTQIFDRDLSLSLPPRTTASSVPISFPKGIGLYIMVLLNRRGGRRNPARLCSFCPAPSPTRSLADRHNDILAKTRQELHETFNGNSCQ